MLPAAPSSTTEPAFAKLCDACPVPASSRKTSRYRLNRGGHRQANAALHRVVVVCMRTHQPTLDYIRRRTAVGKSKREIIRCLKRFAAREIFGYLCSVPSLPTKSNSPVEHYKSISAIGGSSGGFRHLAIGRYADRPCQPQRPWRPGQR